MWAVAQGNLPERRSLLLDYDGCFVAAVSGAMGLLVRGRSVGYRRFLVGAGEPIRKDPVQRQSTMAGVIVQ